MTKRNKAKQLTTLPKSAVIMCSCGRNYPAGNCKCGASAIEGKCHCGRNEEEGSIGCHRYPGCCDDSDEDYEII